MKPVSFLEDSVDGEIRWISHCFGGWCGRRLRSSLDIETAPYGILVLGLQVCHGLPGVGDSCAVLNAIGLTLYPTYREPFNLIAEGLKRQKSYPRQDDLRTFRPVVEYLKRAC
jgi:hypothetical protein